MTTLNITNIAPPTLSGLAVYNTIGGANLEWIVPELDTDVWSTEIWFSTTNDRSTATLMSEVKGANTYFWQDSSGATGFFWIRSKNKFGFSNGPWEPTSSTGGVALDLTNGIMPYDVNPSYLAAGLFSGYAWRTGYDTGSGSSSSNSSFTQLMGIGAGSATAGSGSSMAAHEPGTGYGTYYTVGGSGTIQASTSTAGVNYSVSLEVDWTTPSITTGTAELWVRIRVRNTTNSTDLQTQEFKICEWSGSSATVKRAQSVFYWEDIYNTSIAANKAIEILVDMKKVRSDSATTFSMYWNKCYIWQDREV